MADSDNNVRATISSSGASAYGTGVYVLRGEAEIRENDVFGNGSLGIIVSGANSVAKNNLVYSNLGAGIQISNGAKAIGNTVHDNDTGISAYANQGVAPVAEGNTIHNNQIGIRLKTRFVQAHARNNVLFNNDFGLVGERGDFQSTFIGDISGNLFYDHNTASISITTGSAGTTVHNNTFAEANHDVIRIVGSSGIDFRNNLFSITNGYVYDWSGTVASSHTSDYNQFDLGVDGKLANLGSSTSDSHTAWVIGHQQDLNSVEAAAGFVDPVGPDYDFHLQAGSAGVDQGDPAFPIGDEPAPNGGRINMGAYGGTAEATVSPADEILQVLTPSGLDRYSAGRTMSITWRSQVDGPVDIDLYDAATYQPGVSTPVVRIADDLTAAEQFDWTIPADGSVPMDAEYLVFIQTSSGSQPSDVSNLPFSIANGGNAFYINDSSLAGDVYTTAIGDDFNLGKRPDQPMASLRKLLFNYDLRPGDVIYVDAGTYLPRYDLLLGEELSGIRIQGPVSETVKAIFDGQGIGTGFHFFGADDVTIANLSITNFNDGIYAYSYHTTTSPDSDRISIVGNEIYGNVAKGIYVRHTGVEDWTIEDNRIYNHSGTNDYGIYAEFGGVQVRNNSIFGNYDGVFGKLGGATIENNHVFNNITGLSVSMASASGNIVYDNTTGIVGTGGNILTNLYANEVMGNDVGLSLSADNVYGTTVQLHVFDNRIYDNGTGIRATKSSRYQARFTGDIDSNFIYSNSVGIDLDYASQAAILRNNRIYANTNLGVKLSIADKASVVNNTIVQEVGDVIRIEGSTDQLVLKNNILSTKSGNVLSVAADSFVNQSFDYNLLQQGTDPNAHIGLWGTTVLDSLTEWQTTTGLDANSITGDPGFVDIDGADNILGFIAAGGGYDGGLDDNFLLSAGSIAIDRGDTASAPTLDLLGNARVDDPGTVNGGSEGGFVDLGAYEFQGNSSDSVPPTIAGSVPAAVHTSGGYAGTLTDITLSLSEAIIEIDARSASAYSLLFSGADGIFGNLDDSLISVTPHYEAGATSLALTTAQPLPNGSYRLTLFGSTTLHDLSGLRLDGDADATPGGDYIREFTVEADLPPTSSGQSITIDEDTETMITLLGDDGNPTVEQNLIYVVVSLPEQGHLSRTSGGSPITIDQLPMQLTSSQVYFTPIANTHASSTFTFLTRDDDGMGDDPQRVSTPATVSIAINPVNDAPVIDDAVASIGELSPFGVTVTTISANDPDLQDATADSLAYAIIGGNDDNAFQITQSGRVVLVAPESLNHESAPSRQLTVRVADSAGLTDTCVLTINVLDEVEAQVESVVLNDGEAQQSRVDSLTVHFNRIVELDWFTGGPFRLVHVESGDVIELLIQSVIENERTVSRLQFRSGDHVDSNGNLMDGRYELTVLQSHVSAEGFALDGNRDGTVGDDYTFGAEEADQFFRFFGDSDGDGDVDGQDYGRFGLTFLKSAGQEGFNPAFDFDGDGDVDGQDYGQFGLRFLKRI
ncbi:MAG: hypothetical protein F9B45_02595 [Phycisphaera sp. RhM]|nr:hypothetical protein [Phycisphaera sp. RhM]